jgi:transposase
MKLDRRTVYGWLRAGIFLGRAPRLPPPGKLDPFMPYPQHRWQQGCHNAAALLREITEKGYHGGPCMLRQRVRAWRQSTPEADYARPVVVPSNRNGRAWLLGLHKRDPEEVE